MPVWSHDGKKLAFFSGRPSAQGGRKRLPVFRDEVTGNETFLDIPFRYPNLLPLKHLAWLPDGNTLLISGIMRTGDGQLVFQILRCDVESGDITPLATWDYQQPRRVSSVFSVSPDGETLFYAMKDDQSIRIIHRNIDDGTEKNVGTIPDTVLPRSMAISPTGKQLVVADTLQMHLLNLDSGERRLLYRANGGDTIARGVTWTAAGDYLLFALNNSGQPRQSTLWRIAAAGGERKQLGGLRLPQIQHLTVHPVGHQIAFSGRRAEYGSEVWFVENSLLMKEE